MNLLYFFKQKPEYELITSEWSSDVGSSDLPETFTGHDTLKTRRTLNVDGREYDYFSLKEAEARIGDVSRLPVSLKVLLENLLRFEDGRSVTVDDENGRESCRESVCQDV